jgi:pyruvate/2-oxoglutarate dehydrogenase complex dihydrolipoamide dehydrogenase (E3) component
VLEDAGLRVNAGGASVVVERALVALGRRANLDGLGLETLGAPLDEHGKPVGAELCAPDGEHLAHLLALALERKCTVRDLLRAPFYHPTLEEGLREALRDAAKNLPGGDVFELA